MMSEKKGKEEMERKKRLKERANTYAKKNPGSSKLGVPKSKNHVIKEKFIRNERKIAAAAEMAAAREEYLLPEDAGFIEAESSIERTHRVSQKQLKAELPGAAADQIFKLDLNELGPYRVDWTRNGRHLLLGGTKGHLAIMDALRMNLLTEINVQETVRDVSFLHNESLFAVAQKQSLYIYDRDGVELHCLRQHMVPTRMTFLPYHFLLAVVGKTGFLKYQDTSTGSLVSEHRTKLGDCRVMCQNPSNGVVHLGHHNGVVTLWSPAVSTPLVRMLSHHGEVKSVSVDQSGKYMVSAGMDRKVKVWDLRMFKEVYDYTINAPMVDVDISQRGLLAIGTSTRVQVWRDPFVGKPDRVYMYHQTPGRPMECLRWRPYEDSLVMGQANGVESIVVPGAGEPNYDSLVANPFESSKEKREGEVHSLLDKLGPETIALDVDFVGTVDEDSKALQNEMETLAQERQAARGEVKKREKHKMKGRSKIGAKLKKKRMAADDEVRAKKQKTLEEKAAAAKNSKKDTGAEETHVPIAIRRFMKPQKD